MPASWCNDHKGGIRLSADNEGVYRATCFSGERNMKAGEELQCNFRLLITPFKPIDTRAHFRTRFCHAALPVEEVVATTANTINVHHANVYNPWINYPFLTPDKMKAYIDEAHAQDCRVKFYYTVRELSTRAPELFALQSLNGEVLVDGPGGGHPWLRDHLATNYIAAWHAKEIADTAVINGVLSRWHNFYVEGLDWLARNIEIDGLYLDDVGFSREVMQRSRRALERHRPSPVIDLHSANQYNERDGFASSASLYLELMPYIDRLWFGEYFDYDESPDYWLVEVSGIPFGLMGEMLQGGGNPWRGMVFGMTGRNLTVNEPIWRFWDQCALPESRMIAFYSPNCPVQTGCEAVKATAYVGGGRTVIALASWAVEPVEVAIEIDWDAIGVAPERAELSAPAIEGFQPALDLTATPTVTVEPKKGWLIVVEEAG